MQNLTMKLLAVFIVCAVLKILVSMIIGINWIGTGAGILIDVAMLGYIYVLLREYRYMNVRKFMMFLSGITVISILIDIGLLPGSLGNLLILGIIAWLIFGFGNFFRGGGRRYR